MKKRIPSLDEYINETTQTEKFVIINKHGNYLKSFEYGGISSDWCTDVEEAKVFSTNDTAYNVMGYHLSREIAKESRIQKLDKHVNEGNNQKSFSFKVQTVPYIMYWSKSNRYDIYRYDEDHGPNVITFFYDGKGKIDFRSSNADIDVQTSTYFNEIMYVVMKHLGLKVKSNARQDIDKFIEYNT